MAAHHGYFIDFRVISYIVRGMAKSAKRRDHRRRGPNIFTDSQKWQNMRVLKLAPYVRLAIEALDDCIIAVFNWRPNLTTHPGHCYQIFLVGMYTSNYFYSELPIKSVPTLGTRGTS